MRISDWSSDVCSSDLVHIRYPGGTRAHDQQLDFLVLRSIIMDFVGVVDGKANRRHWHRRAMISGWAPARPPRAFKHQDIACFLVKVRLATLRSEEHTSELPPHMRITYSVFCMKKKNNT